MTNSLDKFVSAEIFEVNSSGERNGGGISIFCMFNPFEYTVSKSNSYEEKSKNRADVPQVEFKKAGSQSLKLSLVFDTYEKGEDVSQITRVLWKLMESSTRREGTRDVKVPPPEVCFKWGVFRFVAVITDMTQKFTLFKHDGTPVRAKVDVTFVQHKDLDDYPPQNPTSGGGPIQRIWQVSAGDRLDTIAYEVYGDSTKWRKIALHNHIVDTFHLRPGQRLAIPLD